MWCLPFCPEKDFDGTLVAVNGSYERELIHA